MFQTDSEAMARLLGAKTAAVVGLSDSPDRPSYRVANYMIEHGIEVIPINPNCAEVLGKRSYRNLKDVKHPVDVVVVFRRPEHCPQVAREAVVINAAGLWLQVGIRNAEARAVAEDAGLDYVEDRCFMVEHSRRGLA